MGCLNNCFCFLLWQGVCYEKCAIRHSKRHAILLLGNHEGPEYGLMFLWDMKIYYIKSLNTYHAPQQARSPWRRLSASFPPRQRCLPSLLHLFHLVLRQGNVNGGVARSSNSATAEYELPLQSARPVQGCSGAAPT